MGFTEPSLKVSYYGIPVTRKRRWVGVEGLLNKYYGVYNSNVTAVVSSLSERYFNVKVNGVYEKSIKVDVSAFAECVSFQDRVVRKLRYMHVTKLGLWETVNLYHGAKKRVYERAARNLECNRLQHNAHWLRTFVKFEKLDIRKPARIIQPRSPEYILELARYLKSIEKRVYKAIAEVMGGPTVIKGMDCRKTAQTIRDIWEDFDDPVAMGLDATKFDMHVSETALKFEHGFYVRVFNGDRKLKRLLALQLVNKGKAYTQDGTVQFLIKGTRSSGDINTSLGNVILMCSIINRWFERCCVRARLVNNGDDCVIICEREDMIKIQTGLREYFHGKGFRITLERVVDEFEYIEFCQSHPVLCSDGWRMIRNVHTCIFKDAMCTMAVNRPIDYQYWLYAVGDCGGNISQGVPIMQAYYDMYKRSGVKCNEQFKNAVYKNTSMHERMIRSTAYILPDTRVSFYKAFGVTPDMQMQYEVLFSNSFIKTPTNISRPIYHEQLRSHRIKFRQHSCPYGYTDGNW